MIKPKTKRVSLYKQAHSHYRFSRESLPPPQQPTTLPTCSSSLCRSRSHRRRWQPSPPSRLARSSTAVATPPSRSASFSPIYSHSVTVFDFTSHLLCFLNRLFSFPKLKLNLIRNVSDMIGDDFYRSILHAQMVLSLELQYQAVHLLV